MDDKQIVGVLNKKVIDILGLSWKEGSVIICGEANRNHMRVKHPEDFKQYGDKLIEIIGHPTYICKHPNKNSIEYIKVFTANNGDHVLVAVRASGTGILFARTLFIMTEEKVLKYKKKNALKPYATSTKIIL